MKQRKKRLSRKRLVILIAITVILICVIISGIFYYTQWQKDKIYDEMKIEFQDVRQIEYGDKKVSSKELVKSSVGTIKDYPPIDTMKIGKQKLKYLLTKSNIRKEIMYEIEIKDTKAPSITLKNDTINLAFGEEYDPKENVEEVIDPIDGKLEYADKAGNQAYWIETNLNSEKAGSYEVIIHARDSNKNESKQTFDVKVAEEETPKKEIAPLEEETTTPSEPAPSKTSEENQPYYVNGILLVNKNHGVPRNYGGGVDETAYAALQRLQQGAKENGFSMPLISGYRSYDYQASLYNNYVAIDGQAAADRYSARPGNSEHQTGLAFDIGQLDNNYGNTPAGTWLAQHAHEYGFIIRYPQGKESVTGYMYEPWHVRYLGSIASDVYTSGLTLEEYLGTY